MIIWIFNVSFRKNQQYLINIIKQILSNLSIEFHVILYRFIHNLNHQWQKDSKNKKNNPIDNRIHYYNKKNNNKK
jgi:hypothetical protein